MNAATYKMTALVFAALTLSGCAGSGASVNSGSVSMLATYQQMTDELFEEPTFSTYERYLSSELIEQIRSDFRDDSDPPLEFLAPPFWFGSIGDSYEDKVGDKQCLAVNGVSVEGEPISVALEYIERVDVLKIRAVEIALFEAGDNLPAGAWCPVRVDEI